MDARQERGLIIAATAKIERNKVGWKVPSQSGNGAYVVNLDHGQPFCSCPDFEKGNKCKHIYAVEYVQQREERPDGTTVVTQAVRVTYTQDWSVYNLAQTHEAEHFAELLHDLCQGIAQTQQCRRGRPSHAMSDVVFAATGKVYSMVSGRRAMCDLEEWQQKGYLGRKVSYNSVFDYLENPELTPLLKTLIEQSASPLRAVETDFAVDSSGFATSTYSRWFDHKYGKERSRQKWVKTHLMCGVHTHIVTAVEATPFESADAPQLPELVKQTAKTFDINEVSADKAYSTRKNLHAIQAVGGTPFIPFKSYSKGSQGNKPFDGLWARMWHFYSFNQACFLAHYHRRSNVETAFSMIKAKFGTSVRSKTPTAQVNEVLCKVLAHNICCLVNSTYELGIAPTFWADNEPHVTPPVAALDVRPWN